MALVEVPDIGNVEFPDDMSKEEMSLAINKRFFPHLVKAQPPSVYGATKAPPVGINEVQAGEMSQYGLLPGQPLAGGMVLGSNLRAPVAPTSTMVDKTTTEPSWEDPTNPWAQLGVGARLEAAHLPAKYASLPLAAVPGVDRAKFSDYLEAEAQKKLGVYDVPEAEGWTNKVARGLGRAPVMMGELLGLGKFISPLASAVSAVPKVASILGAAPRLGPMAESAATFGLQGLLEPHEPLKQAALGVGMGAGFGALAPYAKPVRMLGAGGLGLGTEYIANPNATPEELAASGTVMGLLAGIGGRRGRRVNEKLNITEEDFAPPTPPPDRAPRSGAWIWSGQGDVFEPHAPQTSADLWARNQRIIDEAYGRVPTPTEPPPAPVPTGGLQEPAAERAIGELPEVGTTTPKETLPAPTEHPVLNALREVFPDMDSARLEIERLEREGVLGPVNLHPEFIPGIGHVLRSGKPSFSGLSVDYGEFLDDLNTVRETDPKAFEEAKAEADKNMSAFKELTAQSAADEEAFFADLNEKFIQGQRIATEGTRPSLEFTPDELEQRRLLGQTEGRVLTDVTGNIVGTNVPSGAPPTEIAAITPTVDWFGERPGTRRPTTPTTTVPEVTTEGQSQAIGLEGKRLQTGMLQSAVADFFSRSKANKESALQWIMDKTSKDAFSFEGVMKSFDLDPDEVRDRIISGKVDPNAFRSLKFYSGLGWLPEAWNELKKGSKWLEGIATKMEMKPGKLGVNLKQLISERSTDIGNQAAANTTAIELFQNSLDNARPGTVPKIGIHLERIWREDVTPRKREVRGWLYDPDIAKEYNWKLRFSDDGTGMSPEVVKENLMTYGGVGTKGEFSRGGYGIASTFLFNFPLETTIDTVALVNGQKIRTMVRTSKERFSMGDFDWGSERVADSTPTGTTYTAVMPSGLTESFLDGFKSYANKLRSPAEVSGGGEVVSYGNAPYKNIVKPLSEYPQVASSVPFKIGKSSGTIYFEEGSDSWSEPNKEGVYTFSTRIINKGLPLSVNLPKDAFGGIRYEPDFTVKVDYERTPAPKDNLEEYPFFDNRKSLRDEQVAGIKAILYPKLREMERERVTQRAEEFKQIYKDSPRLLGTKILFDFPSYLHKDVTAALQENLAPLRGAIKIMQTFRDFMTKVGVTFDEMVITLDPTVRGFKTNPHLTGHDLYAFNPVTMNKMLAEDIADAKRAGISEPAMRASNFTHTLIHELAHMEDMSHGQNWGLVVARLYVKATHEGLVNNVERMANAYFTKYGDALEELGKRLSSLPTGRFRLGTSSLGQPRELSYTGEPATTRGPETARGTSDLGIAKLAEERAAREYHGTDVDYLEGILKEGLRPEGTKLYSGLAFAPKALEELKNTLFKGEKLPGGGGISWMSRKYRQNFAIPFWTSKIYENFKPFYETANARREIFTRDATGAMDKVNSWLSMSDEEKASARDLLLTIEGKRLAANPSPMYDSYRVGNITYLKPSDVHMQEYAKWLATKNLSPKTTSFLMAWKQVMAKAFTDHYNESVATGETDPGTLQDLMDNVGNVPNYFPHMWYGDYYVEGKNIDGKVVARVPLSVNILERTLGASGKYQKVVEGLKKDPAFAGLTWGPPQKTSELERFWLNSPVPIDTLERLLDESAKRLEADPNLAPLAQAYRKVIPQEVAQILKTRGFGNFAKRRGVLGYEKEDITKVFYDYVTGVYGGLSKAQAARDYTNLMFKTKPNSEDYKLLSEFVEDEMSTYGKFDRAMDNMRTAFFVKYLGARIKPAVVNLTNMSTSSIPLLGIYTQGESNSTALHAKAALDISKQYIKEFPTHQSRVGIRGLPTDNVLAPDEVRAQVDLLTDDTIQHQMMNEYRGRLKDNLNWNWQAFRYLSAPMEMTEWYIRATTALSAYRAFRDGKITHQPTLDKYGLTKGQPVDMNQGDNYANALDFAKDLVAMAHGDYSQYNKPAILRSGAAGAIGRSMYTFRFFNHHLVEMWNWMLRHEETGRGKAAFAKSMFSQALVGGLKAAPIVSFLMWAYNQWNKESPEDVLRESYPRLGPLWDGAFEGAPGMAGIYLGGSLEVGFPTNVQEAIGIPAAITQDIMNGAAAWTSGNKGRAFEYLAPLVVTRDLLSAYRGYVSGERTIGGRPISTPGEIEPTKLTAPEAIAKALGFRPMSTEARWRLNQTVGDMEAYRKNTQSKYADRYTNAIADEDYDKAADIIDEVIAYNEIWLSKDRPEMVIRKDELTSALRTRLRAKQPSRSMMGRALSLGEGYGLQQ